MKNVRRIASEIMGIGESKIRFNPESLGKIEEALTREDVRALIREGDITAIAKRGVSRVRAKKKQAQKRKGRRSGTGSRKGTFSTRTGDKLAWMAKIRSQRKLLRRLVESGRVPEESSRKIYLMVKGNAFKGVKVLETYLRDNKLLSSEKVERVRIDSRKDAQKGAKASAKNEAKTEVKKQ